MKLHHILRALTSPPLPPVAQPAIGQARDQDFVAPEPGVVEQLAGFWRGHAVYREAPPKPIWLPDPRAERNRKIAAARAARRPEPAALPMSFAVDAPPMGGEPAPYSGEGAISKSAPYSGEGAISKSAPYSGEGAISKSVMSVAERSFADEMFCGASAGSFVLSERFPPTAAHSANSDGGERKTNAEIVATASMLAGSGRRVIPPRGDNGRRG